MRPYLLWLVTIVLVNVTSAADASGQNRRFGDAGRDVRQTIAARKLLADDPELAMWNIGVIVTDRVAVLWGPAPSAEIAYRAEERLRTMLELTGIRNELFVSDTIEPMRKPLKIDNAPQYLPELLPPRLPPIPGASGAPGKLMNQEKPGAKKAAPPKGAKPIPQPIEVLPPEKLEPESHPAPLPRKLPAGDAGGLDGEIRNLLQRKSTFRGVEFAVQGRRVYLKSSDPDALHEAARAISQLPNVEGVVLVEKADRR